MNRLRNIITLIGVFTVLFIVGCGNSGNKHSTKPTVYASFYPIYDLTNKIGEDKINLISFMPEDKEAHHWEPSAKDIKEVNDADLMIVNGAGVEPWIEKIKDSANNLKFKDLSESAELIEVGSSAAEGSFKYSGKMNLSKEKYSLDFGHTHEKTLKVGFYKLEGSEGEEELSKIGHEIMGKDSQNVKQKETFNVENKKSYSLEMGHDHGLIYFEIPEEGDWLVFADRESGKSLSYLFVDGEDNILEPEEMKLIKSEEKEGKLVTYDPHSWISLINAQRYLDEITNSLIELSPENEKFFKENCEKHKKELEEIQSEYEEKFAKTEKKHFVVPHEAYGYICRDFKLEQHPLQGLTSMEDPNLKTVQETIEYCRENDIKTIFYEYGGSKKGAETIASEVGAEIAPLSTMEFVAEEQKQKKQDYIGLMKMNLENIYQSLR